jgi:hypothetical protein
MACSLNVHFEKIVAKVSLNDIVLVSSILSRSTSFLNKQQQETVNDDEDIDDKKNSIEDSKKILQANSKELIAIVDKDVNAINNKEEKKNQEPTLKKTKYIFKMQFPCIQFYLINDFNLQNTPIAKVLLDTIEYKINGDLTDLKGIGSLIVNCDYYNAKLLHYEPFIESFQPTIFIEKSNTTGFAIEISSKSTLQMNISGEFVNCIYRTMWLFSQIGKEGSFQRCKNSFLNESNLVFKNFLEVSVEVFDSQTKNKIFKLENNEIKQVPKSDFKSNYFDLYFLGNYFFMYYY